MKRKVYRVVCFCDPAPIAIECYAWKTALQAIPAIIREHLSGEWREATASWARDGKHHVGGASQWINDAGQTLNFSIYVYA